MKQRKKRIITLDEYLDKEIDKKEILKNKYKKSLAEARATDNDADNIDKLKLKTGYYSMKTRVIKNPWVNQRPASKATHWLFTEVFKNPTEYRYAKNLMYQGGFFTFEYKNPKYMGTSVLPWFDKYPLVISLGPVVTKQGIRNIGFNMHLLPPKIRIIVMCAIFEMYKKLYRYQVFYGSKNPNMGNKPVMIHYKQIIKALDRYGVRFCVRMYIPGRMKQIVRFPIKTWHKAIFIPSRSYDGIKAHKLIDEWKKFLKRNNYATRAEMDWKSVI